MEVLFDCRQEGSKRKQLRLAGNWCHLSLGEWVTCRCAVAAQISASAALLGLSEGSIVPSQELQNCIKCDVIDSFNFF